MNHSRIFTNYDVKSKISLNPLNLYRHIHAWYSITMCFDGLYLLLDNTEVSLVTMRLETSRRNTFTVTLCYHLCNYRKLNKMIAKLCFFFLILEFPEFNKESKSLETIRR